MKEFYTENARDIEVYDQCDVLVVGSGCAGHSAAIAAARAGCRNIVLMERYGYSGGDVTGGYVIMVPNLSWYNKSFVRGLQEEWFTRLQPIPGAVRGPALKDIGSRDQRQIVKDFLIKFTKNLQKRCQKHRMAPDTSFDRLHFSVQQVFAEIRIVWQLVDIWLPAPLDFGQFQRIGCFQRVIVARHI